VGIMDTDKELLESFIDEITELNVEILQVLKTLSVDLNQPEEFLNFSNIIDRIYGTALTLGYDDLGKYCGELKTIARLTGNSGIPRAFQPVMRMMLNYTTHFKLLKESIEYPEKAAAFNTAIKVDLKKIEKMHTEIFVYTDKKNSIIKS
jgi:chemotaxis protein histidine kinase CheA